MIEKHDLVHEDASYVNIKVNLIKNPGCFLKNPVTVDYHTEPQTASSNDFSSKMQISKLKRAII